MTRNVLIAGIAGLVGLVAIGLVGAVQVYRARPTPEQVAAEGRQERTTSIAPSVAPPPLSHALPLVGDPKARDANGYPTAYVDKVALRSMLWHGAFDDLTAAFEKFQSAFEDDPACEYWPIDAGDAFASSEPQLHRALDLWVQKWPSSFAPYLARGTYWKVFAYASRGGKWARETPESNLAAMREALPNARRDLDKALELRPKLVAAMRIQLLAMRAQTRDPKAPEVFDRAIAVCPSCFQIRVTRMYDLTPRWGGSYDQMAALAAKAGNAGRLKTLAGFIDADKAEALEREHRTDEAKAAVDRAMAFGDAWEFSLLRTRLDIAAKDDQAARTDIERAVSLRPQEPSVLSYRAWFHSHMNEWEKAGDDLLVVLRLLPTDETARTIYANVVQGVVYTASEAQKAGRREEALRLFDLAKQLDPGNADAARWRAYTIIGDDGKTPDAAIAHLEDEHRKNPDDFAVLQELDYVLAMKSRFGDIASLWTDYLSRHTDDGPAYMERAGPTPTWERWLKREPTRRGRATSA